MVNSVGTLTPANLTVTFFLNAPVAGDVYVILMVPFWISSSIRESDNIILIDLCLISVYKTDRNLIQNAFLLSTKYQRNNQNSCLAYQGVRRFFSFGSAGSAGDQALAQAAAAPCWPDFTERTVS